MTGASARAAARPWSAGVSVSLPAVAVAAITVLAGVLRLTGLAAVPVNPFYDAAVRSMGLSWHNFFLAAFEPSGHVAIDKPPLDLWLQVASVKLFGFNSVALKLPQAIAGTAAVPLLYSLVRKVFGTAAGLAAALALAVLPVAVLTARSDTMDTVMMLLLVAAAWLVVHAAQTGRARHLYLAGAAVGLAFNVKLFEALLVLPALALLYAVAAPRPLRVRLAHLVAAGAVMVAVSLAWVLPVSLVPAAQRPYPLGSTNGSVWNSVFVFDGTHRLGLTGRRAPPTRARAVAAPSPTRLVRRDAPALGRRVGSELVPALVLGGLALVLALADQRLRRNRLRLGFALGLGVWLLAGLFLFSKVGRLQARYLEAFTPAVAAALGAGLASLVREAHSSLRVRAAAMAGIGVSAVYAVYLASGRPLLQGAVAVAGLGAGALIAAPRSARAMHVALALALVAVLAVPAAESVALVRGHATDASTGARIPTAEIQASDGYLRGHQGSARYEVATLNAYQAAPLIVRAGRPVLVLFNVDRQRLVTTHELQRRVARGEVKYALLGSQSGATIGRHTHGHHPRAATAAWIKAHGRPVTVDGYHGLYRLSGGSR